MQAKLIQYSRHNLLRGATVCHSCTCETFDNKCVVLECLLRLVVAGWVFLAFYIHNKQLFKIKKKQQKNNIYILVFIPLLVFP